MFVPCPHCGFLVALIVTGDDAPRCPRCAESLDSPVAEPAATAAPAGEQTHHDSASAPLPVSEETTAAGPDAVEPDIRLPRDTTATRRERPGPRQPSFLRPMAAPARHDSSYWSAIIAISGLTALLGLQLLLAQRAELAASERWRPVITAVCTVLGCEVPLWHQPAAYTMLARDVQPAIDRPGVLQVKASFRNDARWPQAWPALQLQLTDVNGQAVAARILQPADYHSGDESPPPLAPGQSASVAFQVAEPATPIVAFNFDFR